METVDIHAIIKINDGAFFICKSLENITILIKSKHASIWNSIFCYSKIISITIPEFVTDIYDIAFELCNFLETFTFSIKSKLTLICKSTFSFTLIKLITILVFIYAIA